MKSENGVLSINDERLGTAVELTPRQLNDAYILLHGLMEMNGKIPGRVVQVIRKNIKRLDKKMEVLSFENKKLDDEYHEYNSKGQKLVWDGKPDGLKAFLETRGDSSVIVDAEGTVLNAGGNMYPYIESAEKREEFFKKKSEVAESMVSVRVLKFTEKDLEKLDIPMRGANPEKGIPAHPLDADSFFANFVHGEKESDE